MRRFSNTGSALAILPLLCMAIRPAGAQLNFNGSPIDFSNFQLNGSASMNGGNLQLTPDAFGLAGSAFTTATHDISSFTASFDFHLLAPGHEGFMADGITFTMQTAGPGALGGGGGCDGYCGINPSVAVKFDTFDNGGESDSNMGVSDSGILNPGTDTSPVDLRSQDTFRADIHYDGTTLHSRVTDLNVSSFFDIFVVIDIPTLLGSNNAFIGFTGGTGGASSQQEILGVPEPGAVSVLLSGLATAGLALVRHRKRS